MWKVDMRVCLGGRGMFVSVCRRKKKEQEEVEEAEETEGENEKNN